MKLTARQQVAALAAAMLAAGIVPDADAQYQGDLGYPGYPEIIDVYQYDNRVTISRKRAPGSHRDTTIYTHDRRDKSYDDPRSVNSLIRRCGMMGYDILTSKCYGE